MNENEQEVPQDDPAASPETTTPNEGPETSPYDGDPDFVVKDGQEGIIKSMPPPPSGPVTPLTELRDLLSSVHTELEPHCDIAYAKQAHQLLGAVVACVDLALGQA